MTQRITNLRTWLSAALLAVALVLPTSTEAQRENNRDQPRPSGNTQLPPGLRRPVTPAPPQQQQQAAPPAQNANAQPAQPGDGGRGANRVATPPRNTASQGSGLGAFTVVVDAEARMLRLHPAGKPDRQDEKITISTDFVTEVTLNNQSLTPFDYVRIQISFDSDFLEPISINDSLLAPAIVGDPVAEVDPLLGTVFYEARLDPPLAVTDRALLSIRWKPLKTVIGTEIEFNTFGDRFTAVTHEGNDILGNRRDPTDGTLSMRLSILPDDIREAEAMLSDPTVFMGGDGKIGGVKMFLQPQEEPIIAGEPFYVDIVLDNRAFSKLDGISVLLTYDPSVLTVHDADLNNFITRERNILDGPFQEVFPWTFHIDNVVYQARGLIHYRVGTGDPDMTRGKVAPFARIYATASRPTAGTPLTFRFSRQPRERGTSATYNGLDALGDPKVFADGTRGIVLQVAPPGFEYAASTTDRP